MTDKDILISDLNDISEILNNNGYGGWCVAIRKAVALLKEQDEQIRFLKENLRKALNYIELIKNKLDKITDNLEGR